MMRHSSFLVFVISLLGCANNNQPRSDINMSRNDTIDIKSIYINEFHIYADSINFLKNSDNLPYFLFNIDFDYQDTFYLTQGLFNGEDYSSKRIEIFKYVNNLIALDRIIAEDYFKEQFKKVNRPSRRFDVVSNYNLANLRRLEVTTGIDTLSQLQE